MNGTSSLVAAVETGGTTFRAAVGSGPEDLRAETSIPTTGPDETLAATVAFMRGTGLQVRSLGVAAFGPVDLDPSSASYGRILPTPKPGWEGADVLGSLQRGLGVPAAIETDVGAAALAERRWGAARGFDDLVYVTVGTGIGAGIVVDGRVHRGHGHPEVGHIALEREPDDRFAGSCPFHGACLEGMASGTALAARWGKDAGELTDRGEVWDLEARYLAQAVATLTYTVAPQRIVFGGGVLRRRGLIDRIAAHVPDRLGGYVTSRRPLAAAYVVSAALGQDAGLLGAVELGLRAGEGG